MSKQKFENALTKNVRKALEQNQIFCIDEEDDRDDSPIMRANPVAFGQDIDKKDWYLIVFNYGRDAQWFLKPSDYGKTWALTREELLEARNNRIVESCIKWRKDWENLKND